MPICFNLLAVNCTDLPAVSWAAKVSWSEAKGKWSGQKTAAKRRKHHSSLLQKLSSEASGIQEKPEVAFFNLGCKDKCASENSESSHFLITMSTGNPFLFDSEVPWASSFFSHHSYLLITAPVLVQCYLDLQITHNLAQHIFEASFILS